MKALFTDALDNLRKKKDTTDTPGAAETGGTA
jgi:hypothetical protein